ncbi:hypothetical protein D3C72_1687810 [compost metagenome]
MLDQRDLDAFRGATQFDLVHVLRHPLFEEGLEGVLVLFAALDQRQGFEGQFSFARSRAEQAVAA